MEVLKKQKRLMEMIAGFSTTIHPSTENSTSEGHVKICLELFEDYWTKFNQNHEKLVEIDHFENEQKTLQTLYDAVQKSFVEDKGRLYNEHSKLIHSTS